MKCVICGSPDIEKKDVDEEIRLNNDVIMVKITAIVCESCGERYYSRQTMKELEDIEDKLRKSTFKLDVIGSVFRYPNQSSEISAS